MSDEGRDGVAGAIGDNERDLLVVKAERAYNFAAEAYCAATDVYIMETKKLTEWSATNGNDNDEYIKLCDRVSTAFEMMTQTNTIQKDAFQRLETAKQDARGYSRDTKNSLDELFKTMLPHALINAPTSMTDRDDQFKNKLCDFYDCWKPDNEDYIRCMVLGIYFPQRLVIASHLFRRSNEYIAKNMVGIDNIDDERNGLLMFQPLETAFDRFQISFIKNNDNDRFKLKLFDKTIRKKKLIEFMKNPADLQMLEDAVNKKHCNYKLNKTFGDINGYTIILSHRKRPTNRPFNRCLNLQARLAWKLALDKGWINNDYNFQDFWSDGMSLDEKMKFFHDSIAET
jgi:hypothetical protein